MTTRLTSSLLLLAVFALALIGCKPVTCVEFESPPVSIGDTYGPIAGHHIGDLAFAEDGISVTVDNFYTTGSTVYFDHAEILSPPGGFGSGQSIHETNISLRFDLSAVKYTIGRVTFEYLDLGGPVSLTINNESIIGELSEAPAELGGVTIAITLTPIKLGQQGSVLLTGPVKALTIGGEDLWIDTVCPLY